MSKDKSQFIGVALLSILLIGYFQYFGPKTGQSQKEKVPQVIEANTLSSLEKSSLLSPPISKECIQLENQDVAIWMSPKYGTVQKVVLKNYKGNNNNPVILIEPTKNYMRWSLSHQDNSTESLNFSFVQHNNQVILLASTKEGEKQIKCTYTLPKKGYTLQCKLETKNVDVQKDRLQLLWYYAPQNLEKDFSFNKRNTYAQYKTDRSGVKYAMANKRVNVNNITWLGIKQKFFTVATIAPKDAPFTQGELITEAPEKKEKHTLIRTNTKLSIPLSPIANSTGKTITFYFGPNKHTTLAQIAPGFERNHYLGFTPIRQLNTYIIAPLAKFFDSHTPHYIWVLLLLALFFKLLQLLFLYKDYIITIKLQALQGTIDALKAKYKNKQEAQLAEMSLYTSVGLPRVPFFIKLLIAVFEIPIFMCMVYFIPQNIALRHTSFLWSSDLSSPDNFINLPFYLPLLGGHLSLFALLMCLSSLLRSRKNPSQENTQNALMFKYMTPIIMFLIFNNNAAAFCLYRIFENLISLLPNMIFKLFVNKDYHLAKLKNKSVAQSPAPSKELPRALARLKKKNNKK